MRTYGGRRCPQITTGSQPNESVLLRSARSVRRRRITAGAFMSARPILSIMIGSLSELHAALFQALITAGLGGLTAALYARYRRRYLLWWTVAWSLYLARIAVI